MKRKDKAIYNNPFTSSRRRIYQWVSGELINQEIQFMSFFLHSLFVSLSHSSHNQLFIYIGTKIPQMNGSIAEMDDVKEPQQQHCLGEMFWKFLCCVCIGHWKVIIDDDSKWSINDAVRWGQETIGDMSNNIWHWRLVVQEVHYSRVNCTKKLLAHQLQNGNNMVPSIFYCYDCNFWRRASNSSWIKKTFLLYIEHQKLRFRNAFFFLLPGPFTVSALFISLRIHIVAQFILVWSWCWRRIL